MMFWSSMHATILTEPPRGYADGAYCQRPHRNALIELLGLVNCRGGTEITVLLSELRPPNKTLSGRC
jgi:hypothetical protein